MAAALHIVDQFREHWRALKRGRPGHRFQDHYECARREEPGCGVGRRIALMVVAVICLAIALVLSVIPGPAIPFYILAGGLLATESRYVARGMDWAEVRARKLVAWAKRRWRRLSGTGRSVLIVMMACGSAATAYFGYWLLVR